MTDDTYFAHKVYVREREKTNAGGCVVKNRWLPFSYFKGLSSFFPIGRRLVQR